jgi:hypothetical protein
VVLRAQKEQVELEAEKSAAVLERSRADRRAKTLASAQTALQKYRQNNNTMTDCQCIYDITLYNSTVH